MSTDILELFQNKERINVCAPMVRYSKLQFRSLVRKYDCDLCFTPMILADAFRKSAKARSNEFTTNNGDKPLVVQFAANNSDDFAAAAELVFPYSNGVDLNCGCPQRWAMKDGYGAELLKRPHLIRDLVLQVKNRIPGPYSVSVKIRILEDLRQSIELCRMLEAAGAAFLTIHARTPEQRHQPINLEALQEIRSSVQLPLIANGDVRSLKDAITLQEATGFEGVMAARGLLTNPALFSGCSTTPISCVQDWVTIAQKYQLPFQTFHHHLVFMLEKVLPKPERLVFNVLKNTESVLKFLKDYYDICYDETSKQEIFVECQYGDLNQGSYFSEKLNKCDGGEFEDLLEDSFNIYCE